MFLHRVPAIAIAACLATLGVVANAHPTGAQAPLPHSELHPRVMMEAARRNSTAAVGHLSPATPVMSLQRSSTGTASARPLREVYGFVNAGNLPTGSGVSYDTWNLDALSVVAFFGLQVKSDGTLTTTDTPWSVWNSSALSGLVNAAHAHGVKVVLSIILQDYASGTPTMCGGLANSQVTAQQTASEVLAKGVDGVNIDYESVNVTCANNGQSSQAEVTTLAQRVRAALPAGANLSIDTYASSASDPQGFFNVPAIAPSVDSFFVMAYDMDGTYSGGNWQYAPVSCSRYCFTPTSPLTTYRYNDTDTASQYVATVGAGKVILGLPYYGYTSCVGPLSGGRPGSNAYYYNEPQTGSADWVAPTYLSSISTNGQPYVQNFQVARDAHDASGLEPYSTWQSPAGVTGNGYHDCWRESYWDDTTSLAAKYDLVNARNLRGVGLFSLDYGGGDPGLWNLLVTHFECSSAKPLASPTATGVNVYWTTAAGSGCNPVDHFTVTANPGGFTRIVPGGSLSTAFTGLDTHTAYTFTVAATAGGTTYQLTAPSDPATPGSGPGVSPVVWANPIGRGAVVAWTSPGTGVTSYTVTASTGASVTVNHSGPTPPPTNALVSGLTNGSAVTFRVAARNDGGSGAMSGPTYAVTVGAPTQPATISATAGAGQATVQWRASNPNAAPLTRYVVLINPGSRTVTVSGSPPATQVVITGLTRGTSYRFTVSAFNSFGQSPPSHWSAAVVPTASPAGSDVHSPPPFTPAAGADAPRRLG